MDEIITLDHGSGGLKTARLIDELLVPAFANPALADLGDAALLPGGGQLVFSTDSFVVTPWRFPGGDIGKLAVCGTVNDLCMAGGEPRYLSLSFLIEEGFLLRDLEEIFASGAEHGETEQGIIQRLGTPEEYAAGVELSLGKPRSGGKLAGLVLSCVACVVCFGLFWAAQHSWVPEDAIGFAQGSTSIQVESGVNLSPMLLVLGMAALALAAFFLWKLVRGRKG